MSTPTDAKTFPEQSKIRSTLRQNPKPSEKKRAGAAKSNAENNVRQETPATTDLYKIEEQDTMMDLVNQALAGPAKSASVHQISPGNLQDHPSASGLHPRVSFHKDSGKSSPVDPATVPPLTANRSLRKSLLNSMKKMLSNRASNNLTQSQFQKSNDSMQNVHLVKHAAITQNLQDVTNQVKDALQQVHALKRKTAHDSSAKMTVHDLSASGTNTAQTTASIPPPQTFVPPPLNHHSAPAHSMLNPHVAEQTASLSFEPPRWSRPQATAVSPSNLMMTPSHTSFTEPTSMHTTSDVRYSSPYSMHELRGAYPSLRCGDIVTPTYEAIREQLCETDHCPILPEQVLPIENAHERPAMHNIMRNIFHYAAKVPSVDIYYSDKNRVESKLQNIQSPVFTVAPPADFMTNEAAAVGHIRQIITDLENGFKRASITSELLMDIVVHDFPYPCLTQPLNYMFTVFINHIRYDISNMRENDVDWEKAGQMAADRYSDQIKIYQQDLHAQLENTGFSDYRAKMEYQTHALNIHEAQLKYVKTLQDQAQRQIFEYHNPGGRSMTEKRIELKEKRIKQLEMQRTVTMDMMDHFGQMLQTVVDMLKYYVGLYPALTGTFTRLNQNITIKPSGRTVNQPVTNSEVIAVYHNMTTLYLLPTLDEFCNRIQRLLMYVNPTDNFEEALMYAEKEKEEWRKDQLWERFMHPDVLFSLIPILSWKKDADRQKWMAKLVPIFENLTPDELASYSTSVIGPMCQEVKAIAKSLNDVKTTNRHKQTTRDSASSTGKTSSNKDNSGKSKQHYGGQQGKMNSKVPANATTAYAAQGNAAENDKKVFTTVHHHLGQAVSRNDSMFILTPKGEIPYVAHFSKCKYCHPKGRAGNNDPVHTPPCSNMKCTRCDMIGHPVDLCMQLPTAFRASLSKTDKQ